MNDLASNDIADPIDLGGLEDFALCAELYTFDPSGRREPTAGSIVRGEFGHAPRRIALEHGTPVRFIGAWPTAGNGLLPLVAVIDGPYEGSVVTLDDVSQLRSPDWPGENVVI